jgi:hypothetical protein
MTVITKCDPVENWRVRPSFAQVRQFAVKTLAAAHGSTRATVIDSARSLSAMSFRGLSLK